ncbi:MAG: hypothetical protein H0W78_13735 [Planctomycetes bacterium]|jgi:hypothetical protein|nr:hypothetical protein [Planctomycetota bacterium]
MTDFDHRWQALVTAARQAPAQRAPLSDLHAARFAAHGLAFAARQRESERAWRGMALAASLFLTCLIGLGVAVQVLVPREDLRSTLTLGRPGVPDTLFIPAPPRPPALATLASDAPQWSPARVFDAVGDWLLPSSASSVQEKNP